MLRSMDAGKSWSSVGPAGAQDLDFRSIAATDARHALVATAGTPARVYRTDDGGTSWTIVFEDPRPGAFFDAIAFAAPAEGSHYGGTRAYLVGDPIDGVFQLFVSDDGGQNWQPRVTLPTAVAGEAMFAASCACLRAIGDEVALVTGGVMSRALRSHDGGSTWSLAELPLQHGTESQGAFAVDFRRALELVVVGGDYQEPLRRDGTAAWTDDDGRVWRVGIGLDGYRSSVAVHGDGATCVAVGPLGASITSDGGATWRPFGNNGFHTVTIVGDTVVAVGQGGRIGTTRL